MQQPRQVIIPGMEVAVGRQATGVWDAIKKGAVGGYDFGMSRPYKSRSYSVVNKRAPAEDYDYLPQIGQVAYTGGRVAADIAGHGTRSFLWNAHPEDLGSSLVGKYLEGVPKRLAVPGALLATSMIGVGSGNLNPLNILEGGRTAGYQAINPEEEDSTKSTTPIYDFAVERGFFGRRGRLLPWAEFKEERPDVSFEQYDDYKNYLYNRDDNLLRDLSLGIVKGNLSGINGPEINIMGYSVTPGGVAASLGTAYAVKKLAELLPQNQVTPDDVNHNYTADLNRRSANTERYTEFVGDYPTIPGMEEVMQPSAPPANYQAPKVNDGMKMRIAEDALEPHNLPNTAEPGTKEWEQREKHKARMKTRYENKHKSQYKDIVPTKPRRVYTPDWAIPLLGRNR